MGQGLPQGLPVLERGRAQAGGTEGPGGASSPVGGAGLALLEAWASVGSRRGD